MTRSATPILDLESPAPIPEGHLTFKGLLKALPAAIGLIAIAAAILCVVFISGVRIPAWVGSFVPFEAIAYLFDHGLILAIASQLGIMFLVTVVHEAGHAVGALALGWQIREFRVLPFSARKDADWKIKVSLNLWPGAFVVAEPLPFAKYHTKLQLFALAGPVANLATGIAASTLRFGSHSTVSFAIAQVFIMWSLAAGLSNLLPVHLHGLELDGYSALVICRRRQPLAARIALVRLKRQVSRGTPLLSLNRRWVALAESTGRASWQNRSGIWLAYYYWLQRLQFDKAAALMEKLLRSCNNDDMNFRALVFSECAVFASLRGNRPAALEWKARSEKLFLPEYLRRRVNSYVAWSGGRYREALQEAIMARDAAQRLDDATRDASLVGWNKWIEELEAKADQPGETVPVAASPYS
ncbi:MAG TPA: M50 family metallopeptidase [Candidatus Angelobacter sp.]